MLARARQHFSAWVATIAMAGQGGLGFMPAQYGDGALPQIPIQAVGGGEVFLELSVDTTGAVSGVKALRTTAPFTEAVASVVRGWRFLPAEEELEPEAGKPAEPRPRRRVNSTVLVAGIFRPPTLMGPTFGELPRDVAAAANETPFPLATVPPLYPPLARDDGIVLVEVRVDAGGRVAGAKAIRSAPPFDEVALDAARQWTFRPARVRGAPVETLAYIAFAFRQPITVGTRGRG